MKEINSDDKIKNTETLSIKIRYCKDIKPNMIVEFKGNKYYITKIENYRFLNKEMNLEVVSHRNWRIWRIWSIFRGFAKEFSIKNEEVFK